MTKDYSMSTVDPLSHWPTSSSYVVPLICRESLAKTTGIRACHSMNPEHERPACEIREQADSFALLSVAGISGNSGNSMLFHFVW